MTSSNYLDEECERASCENSEQSEIENLVGKFYAGSGDFVCLRKNCARIGGFVEEVTIDNVTLTFENPKRKRPTKVDEFLGEGDNCPRISIGRGDNTYPLGTFNQYEIFDLSISPQNSEEEQTISCGDLVTLENTRRNVEIGGYVTRISADSITLSHEHPMSPSTWTSDFWGKHDKRYKLRYFDKIRVHKTEKPKEKKEQSNF